MVTDRIEVNPNVMLGKPVVRGTRIPVELILRKLSEGAAIDDLLDAYPRLTVADIQACKEIRQKEGLSSTRGDNPSSDAV